MHSKDELVAAARAVAARRGTRTLSLGDFRRETGVATKDIYRHFPSWRAFCVAAGAEPALRRTWVRDPEIFAAMRDAFLACGGIVGRGSFDPYFRFSHSVLRRRFGSWSHALAAFDRWVAENAAEFPHKDALTRYVAEMRPVGPPPREATSPPSSFGPPWRSAGGDSCGEPVGFRALMHAPTNELGVVLAFGMVAEELGFVVDAVSPAFPDCTAKRRVGETRWESVRIEFEYRSRNFRDHGHDPASCDVIVCWAHDWPSCPIEVLELREAVARLRARAQEAPALRSG